MKTALASLALVTLFATTALAETAAKPRTGCDAGETVTLNINFSTYVSSPQAGKEKYESELAKIESDAKAAGFKKWDLQTTGYSVSVQGGNALVDQTYLMAGNASYQAEGTSQALALTETLAKRKVGVSTSVKNKPLPAGCEGKQ